ncbi:MAG: hypothetical protein ACFBSE_06655 [Prochloraceae cyanobacterium]
MKPISFLKILVTSSIFFIALNKPASAKVKDFSCNFQDGRTIAVVETRSGKIDLID